MEIREYDMMTDEARGIRTAVFVVEKDYRPEFDEWDEPGRATHLLALETAAPWRHAVSTLISTMPINPDVG